MLHEVTIGPNINAQNTIDKHAAGYRRKKRFHRKFLQELLNSRLCDTSRPLIKKKLGRPKALICKTFINEPAEFDVVLLKECSFTTMRAAINLMSVKLFC
jgi:hypothetical protein